MQLIRCGSSCVYRPWPFRARRPRPADPDHALDVEFVLGPCFQKFTEKAKAAGWDADVVAMTLFGLAEAHLHKRKANGATDLAISLAGAKRQQ